MYSKRNPLLVLYITSLAIVGSQPASVWNGIPYISQIKSAVQVISGETEAISGDLNGAWKTQELSAKKQLEPIVDSTYIIDHIKGDIHIVGDKKSGEEILKGASRSLELLVGGAVGGPARTVLGGVAADGTISGIDSAIHKEKKLYGTFDTVDRINHLVDFGLGIAGDRMVVTAGRGAAGEVKGANDRMFSVNTGHHSTDGLTSFISNHQSKPVKPNNRGNAIKHTPAFIDRFADPEIPKEEDGFHNNDETDGDDSNHISESEGWDDSDVDEEDDSFIYDRSEEWDDSDIYAAIHADEVNPNEVGANNENGLYDGVNDEVGWYDENGPYEENGWCDEDGANDGDLVNDEEGILLKNNLPKSDTYSSGIFYKRPERYATLETKPIFRKIYRSMLG